MSDEKHDGWIEFEQVWSDWVDKRVLDDTDQSVAFFFWKMGYYAATSRISDEDRADLKKRVDATYTRIERSIAQLDCRLPVDVAIDRMAPELIGGDA